MTYTSIDSWWWSFAFILIAGWLATDVWRYAGVLLGRRLSETSQVFVLVRAVATSLVAAVISRLILFPSGILAETAIAIRIGAAVLGFAAFMLAGKRTIVGVGVAVGALLIGIAAGF